MWVVVGDFGEELAFSAMDGGGEGGEEEEEGGEDGNGSHWRG